MVKRAMVHPETAQSKETEQLEHSVESVPLLMGLPKLCLTNFDHLPTTSELCSSLP